MCGGSMLRRRATEVSHSGRTLGDEAAHRSLAGVAVPVEQIDADELSGGDGAVQDGVVRIARVADRTLPESDDAGRDMEVARLSRERVRIRRGARARPAGSATRGSRRRRSRRCAARWPGRIPVDLGDRAPAGEAHVAPASPNRTFCTLSSLSDGSSSGRSPTRSACSETRAALLAEQTDANIATASTSVPPAVERADTVVQSIAGLLRRRVRETAPGEASQIPPRRPPGETRRADRVRRR
jgi:hypothetical protein